MAKKKVLNINNKITNTSTMFGEQMYALAEELYPICRSITGNGLRQTLSILQKHIPIKIYEVPTGTAVFDWTVPKEWNIKDAWVKNAKGEKVIDFKKHNLHILNYSIPIHQQLNLEELKQYIHTLPDHPDWIPYRTSYYKETWGFCMTHRAFEKLEDGMYEVFIDSSLQEGSLSYGEYIVEGRVKEEVLLTTHICHPSLANDNLSGITLLTMLAKCFPKNPKYTYRFLFIPGTIGSITWLARNQEKTKNIKHGLVASLLGDAGGFTYKKSRRGDTEIDQVVNNVLASSGKAFQVIDFFPYGYDERQFCSPGFNLAVGNLSRSQFGQFPEYHSSADNLDFIKTIYLQESFEIYQRIIYVLENNNYWLNQNPYCEPQLGKRGLYDAIGGFSDRKKMQMAMLWILNLSDGEHSLLDIAEKSGYDFDLLVKVSELLEKKQVLVKKRS